MVTGPSGSSVLVRLAVGSPDEERAMEVDMGRCNMDGLVSWLREY